MGAPVGRVVAGALALCLLPLGLGAPVGAEEIVTPPRPVVSAIPDLQHQYFGPESLLEWQGEMVFSAGSDHHHLRRLFMTTAHGEPVREVLDPAQELGVVVDGYGSELVRTAGDRLVMMARSYDFDTPIGRTQIWAVEAPGSAAVQVTDLPSGQGDPEDPYVTNYPFIRHLVEAEDAVYFFVQRMESWELWRTDGTTGGTGRLAVLPPDIRTIGDLATVGRRLYFTVSLPNDENGATPSRLWVSDGTEGGTRAMGGALTDQYVSILTPIEDELLIAAGSRVMATDGTDEGLRLVWDTSAVEGRLVAASYDGSGRLYFLLEDFFRMDLQVWSSDGTPTGTRPVSDWPDSGWAWAAAATGGRFYFTAAEGGTYAQRLYGFTEESGVVTLLRDFEDPATDGAVGELVPLNGWMLFLAKDKDRGSELWASDGTVAGTAPLGDYPDVTGGCMFEGLRHLTKVGDALFYVRDHPECLGHQLWKATTVPLPASVRLPDAPELPVLPLAPRPEASPVDDRVDGLRVRARKRQRQDAERVHLVVRVGAAEEVALEVRVRLRAGADGPSISIRRRVHPTSDLTPRTIVMARNGRAARRFLHFLRARPRISGRAVVSIRATDAAGNVERRRIPVQVTLTRT
jgi:ELWxxDGT repeat protein